MSGLNNKFFFKEISKQIEFVFFAFEDIQAELNEKGSNSKRFWYSVQSLLISAANISKILYPSPKSRRTNRERAVLLRENLKLEEDSVLADKKIRNCFEHFDEHLDDFISNYEKSNGVYFDNNISDLSSLRDTGKNFYLRNYNPRTNTVTFKNISYEIQPVIDELIKLKQKLEELDTVSRIKNRLKVMEKYEKLNI